MKLAFLMLNIKDRDFVISVFYSSFGKNDDFPYDIDSNN